MNEEVTYSSGNVFADLGLPDADEMLAKAELAMRLSDIIRERGLTQEQAAAAIGLDQPKVSAILRGKLSGFSIERLIRCLNSLGKQVRVVVEDRPQRQVGHGGLRQAQAAGER